MPSGPAASPTVSPTTFQACEQHVAAVNCVCHTHTMHARPLHKQPGLSCHAVSLTFLRTCNHPLLFLAQCTHALGLQCSSRQCCSGGRATTVNVGQICSLPSPNSIKNRMIPGCSSPPRSFSYIHTAPSWGPSSFSTLSPLRYPTCILPYLV